MDISQQVCSLEQAKKLRELHIEQNSLFSWFGDESVINEDAKTMTHPKWIFVELTNPVNAQDLTNRQNRELDEPIASAFTVAELGVMLGDDSDYEAFIIDGATGIYSKSQNKCIGVVHSVHEAQIRAQVVIYRLENKLITAEEVNNRLNVKAIPHKEVG